MNFKQMMIKLKNVFLDTLFPNDIKCILCGRDLDNDYPICLECLKEDIFNDGNRCVYCDTRILEGNIVCDHCKDKTKGKKSKTLARKRYFAKCFCPLNYQDKVRSTILKLKSDGAKYLAPPFAKLIYQRLLDEKIEFDIIAPVPSHPKTIKKRGYNPAALIAEELGKLCNKPVKELLIKNVVTSNQKYLDYAARQENLKDSMTVKEGVNFKNKTILLVDDVITTCATINTCAALLTNAKKVYACAIARNQLK